MHPHTQLSTEIPISHYITIEEQTIPYTVFEHNHTASPDQPTDWLWSHRLPKGGITLLDGDHRTGRSFLSLIIAAHVSAGTPIPDGPPISPGGVVIITPNIDARKTQFPFLASQGANLQNIEFLSYVHDPETATHPSGYRRFSFPQDLPRLLASIERINAQLIVLDPFIELLSTDRRWTERRLSDLLNELNQHLIARNIACLLIRDCPAKGGYARPSLLERSQHFERTAMSRLLVAHDPFQPSSLLLTHAKSFQTDPTSTLTLHLQKNVSDPRLPTLTFDGTHTLQATDFMTHRPDALHHKLLCAHLLQLITAASKPIHASILNAQSPHSSRFQVYRSLRELLNSGDIQQPTRGFYSLTPPKPVYHIPGQPLTPEEQEAVYEHEVQETLERMKASLRAELAQPVAPSSSELTSSPLMLHLTQAMEDDEEWQALTAERDRRQRSTQAWQPEHPARQPLFEDDDDLLSPTHSPAAGRSVSEPAPNLNTPAAQTPTTQPAPNFNTPAAQTPITEPAPNFNTPAAQTPTTEPAPNFNTPAATTLTPGLASNFTIPVATSPIKDPMQDPRLTFWADDDVRQQAWREMYFPYPDPANIEEIRQANFAYRRFVDSLDPGRVT